MDHTEAQKQAIENIGQNLQIIACAGSGKTRVVAARVVNILRQEGQKGIRPENIVAFTFTDKAAAELKDRITRMYRDEFGHVEGLAGMYVGTIHGFCLDLLQKYVPHYLKFDVLDEVRQRLLVDRNYQKSGMSSLGLKRWVESGLYVTILRVLRETDSDPNVLDQHPAKAALESYQQLLENHRYLDYDEMLLRAVVELESSEELREAIRNRVKYLTVDEYQDVNPIQEFLIRQIHDLGANLCVVGDDDQNVYQWRGSDVRHIVEFSKRYPDVAQVPLTVNFRSSPAVVDVSREAVEVNSNRLAKEMQSGGRQQFKRGDLLCLRLKDPQAEAIWIADKILGMRGLSYIDDDRVRGLSWSDCAILLRSVRRCAEPIVSALRARGIPYVVSGMTGLFDTLEVQAAVGIFRFMIQEIEATDIRQLWHQAGLGLTDENLNRGIELLTATRTFEPGKRFSVYNLQRTYLDFLETAGLREERIPSDRGEVVYYNLGKFSQVITDYEEIHYKSKPEEKYRSFVQFLLNQAPGYYPEGGQDVAYAIPDAVRIMTVHQAKGMEFPVVFLPCLQKNRFPSKKQHNRVWDHIPREAIRNADRYDTGIEDERRLFYVAMTRSEKYLFCSWAPDPDNQLYRKPSLFWEELTRKEQFLTRDPGLFEGERLQPEPRRPLVNVELSFSDLKYFFECPYQFKLRFLYGFNPPLHEALGYGRSLHNALAEIHQRALSGSRMTDEAVPDLLDTHLHVRYAYPELEANLRRSAGAALDRYLKEHGPQLDKLLHAEEVVELTLEDGIVVHGRIDLIKRTDTNEVVVVDFKSVERAQAEEITRLQLHVYALGYEQRFGQRPDLIEVHNLDHGGSVRELVDQQLSTETLAAVKDAGHKLRANELGRLVQWCQNCVTCDLCGICRVRSAQSVP
jgi:DNA helicase-2/ATP-dependent DNA helicase PcrA